MIYLIHCKNLCKCHNVSPPITIIKGEKIEEGTLFNLLCEVSIALTPKLSKDTIGKPQTTIHAK
jgi:hypothetical protein